jgi:succinate dehydrogenase / fumarate reductase iron-sulfur subunit
MNETSQVTITIREARDRSRSFLVPVQPHTTVVDALDWIRVNLDGNLLYRHSCHHGSCGTCGMLVNGRSALGCLTNAIDAADENADATIALAPLPTMNPLADLAVDPTPLFTDFPRAASYLRTSEFNRESVPPEEIDRYERFENCIECGLCVSVCPVIPQRRFTGPAALAAYSREIENHPERTDQLLDEVDSRDAAWGCDRHLACSHACPTGVYPAKEIARLRKRLEKRTKARKAADRDHPSVGSDTPPE